MDLKELIAKLVEQFTANGDEVVTALQTSAQGLYQRVFDKGHSVGLQKGRDEKKTSDAEVTRLTTELETANASLKELRDKAPDVATVTAQFQREIADLKQANKDAIAAERKRSRDIEVNRQATILQQKLEKKLVPLAAKLLVKDPDVLARIHPKDDGSIEVMQAGKEIPFSPAKGQDALDLLVEDLVKNEPTDHRRAETDEGSGLQNGSSSTGGKNTFDRIREQKKAEIDKRAKQAEGIKSLDEKLGVTRSA